MESATAEARVMGKEDEAKQIVKNYMWWSMGAGLIPYPIADLVAISGVQIKMLSELSQMYNIPFSENRGKSVVSALLGSLGANTLAYGAVGTAIAGSLTKVIPVFGTLFGAITLPAFAGAVTYAIGKVFITHFEAGGTFLDFDPAAVREHFQREFQEGKNVAKDLEKKGGTR